jgi:threonine aldolase
MNFKSDHIIGISPEIMQAIVEANQGTQNSYGQDEYSSQLTKVFSDVFEKDVSVYLTSTGTAANSLGLSALVKPFESIYAHKDAHIYNDECNAPTLFTGGAKIVALDGKNGKIDTNLLKEAIENDLTSGPHVSKPGCISLTQGTEWGTVYSLEELSKIKGISQKYDLPIHMDGARFTGSLVHLGVTPAEMTWKMGVDVMSFGATKNGAMSAEAVVFFNKDYAKNFDYLQKRSGQLMPKMRFFACQFLAHFKDDLWIKNARHSNKMAQDLFKIFQNFGFESLYPIDINEIFIALSPSLMQSLEESGAGFHQWNKNICRFVTSAFTTSEDLESFKKVLGKLA